jgi:hypothetical protein
MCSRSRERSAQWAGSQARIKREGQARKKVRQFDVIEHLIGPNSGFDPEFLRSAAPATLNWTLTVMYSARMLGPCPLPCWGIPDRALAKLLRRRFQLFRLLFVCDSTSPGARPQATAQDSPAASGFDGGTGHVHEPHVRTVLQGAALPSFPPSSCGTRTHACVHKTVVPSVLHHRHGRPTAALARRHAPLGTSQTWRLSQCASC